MPRDDAHAQPRDPSTVLAALFADDRREHSAVPAIVPAMLAAAYASAWLSLHFPPRRA